MTTEIEEIKKITEKYVKELKEVSKVDIIRAKRLNGQWEVIVRYATSDNPYVLSLLLINWDTKEVDEFREGILTY